MKTVENVAVDVKNKEERDYVLDEYGKAYWKLIQVVPDFLCTTLYFVRELERD